MYDVLDSEDQRFQTFMPLSTLNTINNFTTHNNISQYSCRIHDWKKRQYPSCIHVYVTICMLLYLRLLWLSPGAPPIMAVAQAPPPLSVRRRGSRWRRGVRWRLWASSGQEYLASATAGAWGEVLAHVGAIVQLWPLYDQSEDVLVRLHQFLDAGWFLVTNGCIVHLCVKFKKLILLLKFNVRAEL